MRSSYGGRYTHAPENHGGGIVVLSQDSKCQTRKHDSKPCAPPSHPAATAEVGQLLDLGLALGHQRFELVSLAGRDDAGMVAAHAWAEAKKDHTRASNRVEDIRSSIPRPPLGRPLPQGGDDVRSAGRRQELHVEVEWLRERVDNLSKELVLARRDSARLAQQLKQEEGVGREQRRKADDAVGEARALREELGRLKEARTVHGEASRAALADAHDRSVRMAERRRRQQAESLMQAYKGLYEDQLQAQHASAESYRCLARGYGRLSATSKPLRQETVASAAAPLTAPACALTQTDAQPYEEGAAYDILAKSRRAEIVSEGVAGFSTTSAPLVRPINDCDAPLPRATAAESAAAVATAAAAVAAAAEALAVHAADSEHAPSHEPAGRAKGFGCARKSGASPTDSDSTAETLTCSPSDDAQALVVTDRGGGSGVDGTAPAGRGEGRGKRSADPPAAGITVGQERAPIAKYDDRGDGKSCTSAEAFAFPWTGRCLAPSEPQDRARDNKNEKPDDFSAMASSLAAIAIPPVDPAPRWRGRSVGPRRGLASASSWPEAVDAPKRSSSPTQSGHRTWGVCGGGGRGLGGGYSAENGCTRIEPSRARPHSI